MELVIQPRYSKFWKNAHDECTTFKFLHYDTAYDLMGLDFIVRGSEVSSINLKL
jgi:hypothetical protein